ncbi:hypothetical protein [Kibdelosporangium aridum]|uniref:Uncharacterized protein n=1 Tax=Kibdelosporangium aridum TaxID=2030 RepID=A0A1W2FAG3_KIBAR|nr:hypothetical protein [Kibdelosporangium aridum]SMD18937.1 hypothetical protein SAMN05661093_05974 [Kibdelosporangium aridum]
MRISALTAAVAGLTMIAAPAMAGQATTAAPDKCGNHAEPVPGGQQYERKYFWGNCENTGVKINVWFKAYSGAFDRFDRQVCAPAQTDTQIGHTINYLVTAYYVKDTAGTC